MRVSFKNHALGIVTAVAILLSTGCAMDPRHAHEEWKLPKKEAAESAMIIGRIAMPDNKEENPDSRYLLLYDVVFFNTAKTGYFCHGNMPCGEKAFTMYNGYFVVPNLKPGKYYFQGFATGNVFNSLPEDALIELKPGQILYLGSFDYLEGGHNGVKSFIGLNGSYSLRPNKKPTEVEMLQWLYGASNGSGWEPVISKRIKVLGGKTMASSTPVNTSK